MILHLSTKKLLIILSVADVLAIGAYGYGFNLLLDQNRHVAEAADQVSSFSLKNDNLSSLQSALVNAEQGMKEIDEYYIAPDGAVDFIDIIESIAKNRGLTVSVGSVETSDVDKDTKDFQEHLVLRLKTEGSWANMGQFLRLIENLPYNAYITEAELTKLDPTGTQNAGKSPARWRGEFVITALKLK